MLEQLKTYEFLESVGLLTLASSITTMILTGIVKLILNKTKVLHNNTNSIKKDVILSRIGRVIGLLTYSTFYIVNVLFIKKTQLVIDIELITSLLSGSTLTLIVSKGIYTMIHQMEKKNTVYEKLEVAEQSIVDLQNLIDNHNEQRKINKTICEEKTIDAKKQKYTEKVKMLRGEK